MIRELIIQPEAQAELADAYSWYEDQAQGLGSEFLESVDGILDTILRSPEMYPSIYRDVRRAVVRRFPYGILYVVHETRVYVISVFHAKRDPRRWQRRI